MRRSTVASIDEPRCIGCTRCIEACPVDAISGASGLMHTVVAAWCIGCGLCLPPCPVDCIAMVAAPGAWTRKDARAAQRRYAARKLRLAKTAAPPRSTDRAGRRAIIAAALARAGRK